MSTAVADKSELWAAIGEPTRQQVINQLLDDGPGTATSLAADLPVTRQAVAKHLVVLNRAGLVEASKRGREVRYALKIARLMEAADEMSKLAAQWDKRLLKIKQLAEKKAGR